MRPIVLPWPPTVNHYWERSVVLPRSWGTVVRSLIGHRAWPKFARYFSGSGAWPIVQTFIGARGKAYRVDVQAAVWERFGVLRPTQSRLLVVIAVHPPDRRARDLDNVNKAVLDALTHAGVWVDDEQIDGLVIVRRGVEKPGRLEVRIERLTDEPKEQRLLALGGFDESKGTR